MKQNELTKKAPDYQQSPGSKRSRSKWVNGILIGLFFCALFLTILEMNIYRKTMVNVVVLTFVWFSTGIIMTPMMRNFLKKHGEINNLFLQLVFNIVTWGGFVIFGFMATNYYLPTGSSRKITKQIINAGHMAKGKYGCAEPYCEVIIDQKPKQLVFPCGFLIAQYQFVELTLEKGCWGFEVIKKVIPIK